MSDRLRVTSLYSGMDTESIVSQLVSAKSMKVTKMKNEQTRLEWKQAAWQDLNSKIYSLYSDTLSKIRLSGAYKKKVTTCSDATKASIIAGDTAVNGTMSLKINKTAKGGHLTGAKLDPVMKEDADGKEKKVAHSSSTLMTAIDSRLDGKTITVTAGTGDNKKTTDVNITADMTIGSFVSKLSAAGVNASFDETNQRFFINSSTGLENEFSLQADFVGGGVSALQCLGLKPDATYANGSTCTRVAAQDAEIELNGAVFTSTTNSFAINGLTINALGVTEGEISITTTTDHDGIYDVIKDFLSEYNEIINEVCKKYNAESARDYDILSAEEKEVMTEEQVEEWESKIKSSLLRKDNTLYSFMSSLTTTMSGGVEINGKKMYLSDYGIKTLDYFNCEENEHYAYHIDGDADDSNVSDKPDKLKTMIAADPDMATEFFSSLCKKLYESIDEMMCKRNNTAQLNYSSMYKIYNDKELKKEYEDYTKKIKEAEEKLSDYEDRWYEKFSAMEVALSKLQSNSSVITNMLGSS